MKNTSLAREWATEFIGSDCSGSILISHLENNPRTVEFWRCVYIYHDYTVVARLHDGSAMAVSQGGKYIYTCDDVYRGADWIVMLRWAHHKWEACEHTHMSEARLDSLNEIYSDDPRTPLDYTDQDVREWADMMEMTRDDIYDIIEQMAIDFQDYDCGGMPNSNDIIYKLQGLQEASE